MGSSVPIVSAIQMASAIRNRWGSEHWSPGGLGAACTRSSPEGETSGRERGNLRWRPPTECKWRQQSNQANSGLPIRFVAHSLVSIWCPHSVGRFSTLALLRRYEKRLLSGVRDTLAEEAGSLLRRRRTSGPFRDYCLSSRIEGSRGRDRVSSM
jgi:hypothetical protein